MKRIVSLVLSCIILCSLCACGGNSTSGQKAADSDNKQVIEMNPTYVAVDDENVKVEVTSVSSQIHNSGRPEEYTEYAVNLTITNKSDEYDVSVNIASTDACIGPYTVTFGNLQTDTKAGKINDIAAYTCIAYTNNHSQDSMGVEHITSLEDLLLFNAEVEINQYYNNGQGRVTVNKYQADISLEDS